MKEFLFVLAILWGLYHIIFGASWQLGITFLPLAVFGLWKGYPAVQAACCPVLVSVLTLDISMIRDELDFSGVWKYLVHIIPGVAAVAVVPFLPGWLISHSIVAIIFQSLMILLFVFVLTRFIFVIPVFLVINRLKADTSEVVIQRIAALKAQRSGKSVLYYAEFYAMPRMELSGTCYIYLKLKGLQPDDAIRFRLKKGPLGVTYVTGFPRVVRSGDAGRQ